MLLQLEYVRPGHGLLRLWVSDHALHLRFDASGARLQFCFALLLAASTSIADRNELRTSGGFHFQRVHDFEPVPKAIRPFINQCNMDVSICRLNDRGDLEKSNKSNRAES